MAKDSGYEDSNIEVEGYWEPESGKIHVIPFGVKLLDNNQDPHKPSPLVFARLVDAHELRIGKGEEAETFEAEPGAIVGIWFKPGMKGLHDNNGLKTTIEINPEKDLDTGKGNPMKGFDVKNEKGKPHARLPILEDARDKSRSVPTLFDGPPGTPF